MSNAVTPTDSGLLDRLLCAEAAMTRCRRDQRATGYGILALVVAGLVYPTLAQGPGMDGAPLAACGLVIAGMVLLVGLLVWTHIGGDWALARWSRLHAEARRAVPQDLLTAAHDLYGHALAVSAALECHEAHMPGDCPLCGAQ